jgi:hypothetical protein
MDVLNVLKCQSLGKGIGSRLSYDGAVGTLMTCVSDFGNRRISTLPKKNVLSRPL